MGIFSFLQKEPFDGGSWLDNQREVNPDLANSVNLPQVLANTQTGGTFNADSFNSINKANGTFGGYGSKMGSSDNSSGGLFSNFLTKTDKKTGMQTQGWGNFGLSALQAGAGLYLGKGQLDLAKDQYAEAKSQFGKNFGATVQDYNTTLQDRQNRRYLGAGGDAREDNPYQKTAAYMDENRMVA